VVRVLLAPRSLGEEALTARLTEAVEVLLAPVSLV
jgi:hypothetical protein